MQTSLKRRILSVKSYNSRDLIFQVLCTDAIAITWLFDSSIRTQKYQFIMFHFIMHINLIILLCFQRRLSTNRPTTGSVFNAKNTALKNTSIPKQNHDNYWIFKTDSNLFSLETKWVIFSYPEFLLNVAFAFKWLPFPSNHPHEWQVELLVVIYHGGKQDERSDFLTVRTHAIYNMLVLE